MKMEEAGPGNSGHSGNKFYKWLVKFNKDVDMMPTIFKIKINTLIEKQVIVFKHEGS